MLCFAPDGVQRARDVDEIVEERSRLDNDLPGSLPVEGLEPGSTGFVEHVAFTHCGGRGLCVGQRLQPLGARLAGLTARELLAVAQLRLCHSLGRKTAVGNREVGEADAQRRIGQLACGHCLFLQSVRFGE